MVPPTPALLPGVSISSEPTDDASTNGPPADRPVPVGDAGTFIPQAVTPPADGLPAGGSGLNEVAATAELAGLQPGVPPSPGEQDIDDEQRDEAHQDGGVSLVARIRAVLRVGDFRKLWMSMALSSLGDWLGLLAITATATSLVTGSAGKNYALGGVLLFRLLPAIVLGPLAGAFADRFDRRKTMVVSDVLRFGLYVSIPLAGNLVWLFIAQFLIEALSLFWIPAKEAAVPNLIRKDQLEPANQLSLVTTYGLTPVLASALFALFNQIDSTRATGIDIALYLNAASFGVAALVIWNLPSISGRRATGTRVEGENLLGSLRDGLSFAGQTPLVRGLVVGITGAFLAAGVVIATGQGFATSVGGGETAYGLLFGAVFIGLGVGIALGPSVARDLARERLFGVAIVGAGVVVALLAWTFALWIALLLVALMGFFAGVAYLAGFTMLGTEVDDELRGRTFALVQSLVRVALILSLAVAPFVVGLLGSRTVDLGAVALTVTGERLLIFAAGLLAVGVGVVAYRQMDDGRPVPLVADVITALRRDTTARRRLARGGVLIAFEGGEGGGKSTQIRKLQEWLTAEGLVARATLEPGATAIGGRVRRILLDPANAGLSPRSETLLYAADRAQHVHEVLRPALEAGEVVLTDRFIDSSLAYQGAGRTIPTDDVRSISRWATGGLQPDLTVLLDLPPEVGLARARGRAVADRLESESLEFHQRVRRTFLALAEAAPDRYHVLDARRPADELAAEIRIRVDQLLSGLPLQQLTTSTPGGPDGEQPAVTPQPHP